ncbi:carboxypeptidase M32 [Shouchella clausii]|uniref:carboxypeptidase M32 n=1 Tax=Shouchella clausii TaxID=79880 RepID=UPI00079880CC|nr:carboxypeptidase M32 [Shouchella clausii]KKI85261.1 peptidase M32 [Shouchella clausii]MDO7268196.1 carboxypeptidase M32 [Shouchella clausii]MDO7288076.1 carboxypeptidase M32 [Shouchella clausii]
MENDIQKKFLEYVKKINHYKQAMALMAWDGRTGAPKAGVPQRAEVLGTLSAEVFAMSVSDQMKDMLAALDKATDLSDIVLKSKEHCQKTYDRNTKIPADEFKAYVMLQSTAESVWEEAKEKNDFAMFQPYLEELVSYNKKFIEYRGYEGHPYNTLLDDYEPGVFTDTLDRVFAELKAALIPLVKKVSNAKKQPNTAPLYAYFPKGDQEKLSHAVLKHIGYDFDKGRLNETVHPFAIGINPNDVRVTTKYNEHDFRVALLGTIHEGGHALYEQNIDHEFIGTPLSGGTSMGIHESQSLFFEKFVGQSLPFWKNVYPLLKQHAGSQFDDVELEDFYFALNESRPSLIRIEADELTYCLHIILRYELEKGLFEGTIEVKDLPRLWNDKMEEYLGIRPENDGEGVLQDVHWSSGSFGYFPSYALGYIYAAQMKQAMLNDLPNFDQLLEQEQIGVIREWLTKHVHRYGSLKKPQEIIADITGKSIDAKPLLSYLTEKYSNLYELS